MPFRPRPVLFLDTNVLHYIRLYLDLAKREKLPPFGKSSADPDKVIKRCFPGRAAEHVTRGRTFTKYLKKRCAEQADVVYSPITCLETMCGLLKGSALLAAAKEGAPDRMFSRLDETEVLSRLDEVAYSRALEAVENCREICFKADIALHRSDPEGTQEVWALAEGILGNVFLNVGDTLVFAGALLEEADEVVTADGYLRRVIEHVHNPIASPPEYVAYFTKVKANLTEIITRVTGREGAAVVFPRAHMI